ncbi:Ig-like domain-containing protein, partial [Aequitasia blattaphilus]
DYQLKVFNEEVNGENCTDYASTPENIALKINPKPIPVSTVNFPTASSITYGATLADAQLSGGTADSGSFAWEDGTTVPTVGNSGYTVVFTPNDVINYDYSGVSGWDSTTKTVRRVVAVPVSKATPDMALQASPSEGSLVGERVTLTAVLTGVSAGGSPTGSVVFKKGDTILGTVPLSNGKASYLWKDVPYGQHKLSVEYTGDTNYEEKKGNFLNYEVGKKNQSPLTITGVPKKLVYGDADFTLGAKGGNGSGALSYTLESGDGISIKGNKVSILKAGTAVIKVTKAADDTYNETSEVIRITIDKAEPVIQKSPSINGAKAGKTLQELSLEKLKAYGVDGKA